MRYGFGDCVLDTATLQLTSAGREVEIEPQVFGVLAHLVANRERVVSKQELLDEIWGSRFVSESALTTRIKQARRAVGDTGQLQEVIRTFHGRGYRFVAPVKELPSAPAPAGPTADLGAVTPPGPAGLAMPRTRYAESDGASIAYQTFGEGPDVVLVAGFATNVEVQWEHPSIAGVLRALGSFCRLTVLDKRGVGLSERLPPGEVPSLETRADDLRAVLDAAGVRRATIIGSSEGGSLATVFAAAHPERVERLVLHNTWVTGPDLDEQALEEVARVWGSGAVLRYLAPALGAEKAGRNLLARLERQSATPRTARVLLEMLGDMDIGGILGAVSVPTLVLHRVDDEVVPVSEGRHLAEAIPGARLVELPGADHFLFSGDTSATLECVREFVVGGPPPSEPSDRVLATVLFVDVVDSTRQARRLGDAEWVELLERFYRMVDESVRMRGGEVVNTTGDGAVAIFDGPGRAVRAAAQARDAAADIGLRVRAGVHTAEIQRRGADIAGIGVHIASRVAGAAQPGEVWVSRTVTDLVAGAGLGFEARGSHELKGIDEPWALFSATV